MIAERRSQVKRADVLRSRGVKIFYGICGEGLGHSGRAVALIERLVALGHEVTIFTFGDAFRLLARSGYYPHRIEGLRWCENSRGGIAPLGTLVNFARFLHARRESLDMIRLSALAKCPDLVITDFEPLTALVAGSLGIRCVSLDNQHRFCQPLGSQFPFALRTYGRLAGEFVERWIHQPQQCIIAVFHECRPSRAYRRVNALLRESISRLISKDGEHLLIYARGEIGRRIAQVAARIDAKFIAYGFDGPPMDNIQYKRPNYDEFAADLASCRAVIALAGHQLISEARYFGKPLLVIPLPNQHEQSINAHFVRLEGIGSSTTIDCLTASKVRALLDCAIPMQSRLNGVDEVLEILEIGRG